MRTFVMGDIHGNFRGLKQCFQRAGFDYENDILIQLGDIVDGWGEVYECVEELLKIKNLIAIKGNHDEWFNLFIKSGIHPVSWMQGGDGTKKSYQNHCHTSESSYEEDEVFIDIPESHRTFFNQQHLYYIDEQERMFVHGGFDRDQPVQQIKSLRPAEFYWNRNLWNKALSIKVPGKLSTYDNFKEIFIGHTATVNWNTDQPMYSGGIWNLDTGSGYAGKLTIMNVDTKEYFQSDLVKDLYPNESGRS